MSSHHQRGPSAGMTLVEIMMAMGLVSVIALGIAQMMSGLEKQRKRANLTATAQMLRQNFTEMFTSNQAWVNILNDEKNTTFDCLRLLQDCWAMRTTEPERAFQVRDAANAVFFAGLEPTAGFTGNGGPCTGYPSRACPFRMVLTWRSLCGQKPPCLTPQAEVSGRVVYTAPSQQEIIAFNPENYAFRFVKSVPLAEMPAAPEIPPGSPTPPTPPAASVPPPPPPVAAPDPGPPGGFDPMTAQKAAICAVMKPKLNDPNFVALMVAQMKAMGIPEETIQGMGNMSTYCAGH